MHTAQHTVGNQLLTKDETVFIVDDDHGVRASLEKFLGCRGYIVQSFQSAESFLSISALPRPSCLLLDVKMPGLSGLKLQSILGEKNIRIPIIFMSGVGNIPTSVQAIRRGALDFLEKPFSQEDLMERIDEAFQVARAQMTEHERQHLIAARLSELTIRQRQIMHMLIAGSADASSKHIARRLRISHRTVEHHRSEIMKRMRAKSLADLVLMVRAYK